MVDSGKSADRRHDCICNGNDQKNKTQIRKIPGNGSRI